MEKHKVIEIRHLTDTTFIVRLERKKMQFCTGQFVMVSLDGHIDRREYSIFSGEQDDFLEILVREVTTGKVTPRLKRLEPGASLYMEGPLGFFRFNPEGFNTSRFLFVATGTGISPFHSFIRTYPNIDYLLVHGTRLAHEQYGHNDFDSTKLIHCTSAEDGGTFRGRVTDFLKDREIHPKTHCFLCGNSNMIFEMYDLLSSKNIPASQIYTEVYF